MKITEIKMVEQNGYHYPVFITEDGTEFHQRLTPTGSCWALDWAPNKKVTPTPLSN